MRKKRKLLLFTLTDLQSMLDKGNIDYVRHYESWFEEVHVVYLFGGKKAIRKGRTYLVPLGSGIKWIDLLLSPIRLHRYVKKEKTTHYLTADIIFSWWTTLLLRMVAKVRIVLMPVCLPEELYKTLGRSMSGLPIWLERLFTRMCFSTAFRVIMGENSDEPISWLRSSSCSAKKLKIVSVTVEEYPPRHFYDSCDDVAYEGRKGEFQLLYVGRLHQEKRAFDLVEVMRVLRGHGVSARLHMVGDGPDRSHIEKRIKELELEDRVVLYGEVNSRKLPAFYRSSDIFVSTVTGTSLREAGLMGVPIVAYEIDWVGKLLKDGVTGFLAKEGDPLSLAKKLEEALSNHDLRKAVARAFQEEALRRWSINKIKTGLEETFGDIECR